MIRGSLRNTSVVARLYLLRGWRRALDRPRTLALRAAAVIGLWLFVVVGETPGGLSGEDAGAIEGTNAEALRQAVRGAAAALWLFSVATALGGTPVDAGAIRGGAFLLRAAGVRATLWGVTAGRYARRIAFFGAFAVATGVVVLWGADVPARDPLVPLALVVFFLTAELAGMTLRLGTAAVGIRPGRTTAVVLGGTGVVAASLAAADPEAAAAALSRLPVAAFGESFLLGVEGVRANRSTVLLATAVGAAAVPVLAVSAERLARQTWFAGGQRDAPEAARTRVDGLLGRFGVAGPTRAVAWRLWLQSRRDPLILGLLAVPVIIIGLAVVDPGGTDIPVFPLFVGLYAVWLSTLAVALGPLSSEQGTLPQLLSGSGEAVVAGYLLVTALVGVPVTIAAAVLGGVLIGPLSLTPVALVICWGAFVGTAPASVAIGLVLPQVERLGLGADAQLGMSKLAFVTHAVALAVVAGPGALGVVAFESPVVASVGALLSVGLGALVGVAAFWTAVRRFDRLTLS